MTTERERKGDKGQDKSGGRETCERKKRNKPTGRQEMIRGTEMAE